MFVGKAFHTIDDKGRLVLPASFRRVLEADGHKSCVLTQSTDGCLMLFRPPDFQRRADELMSELATGQMPSFSLRPL